MKKLLAVLTVVAVIALGVIGALAVTPHAHGGDLTHSQNKDCPVYQFGLGHAHADIVTVNVVVALFLFAYCITIQKSLPYVVSGRISFLRGPPSQR